MEACESRQQLHSDGFIRNTVCDVAKESQASFCYHVRKHGTPWHCHDFCICYMTTVRNPQDLVESPCIKCIYPGTQVPCWGPCFTYKGLHTVVLRTFPGALLLQHAFSVCSKHTRMPAHGYNHLEVCIVTAGIWWSRTWSLEPILTFISSNSM